MEIKIGSKQILFVLHFLSWILFVALCIEAGGFITSTIYTLFFNSQGAKHFWEGNNFEALYNYDSTRFASQTVIICIVTSLKAFMFYIIVKLFHDKKINLEKPFNLEISKFLFHLSYLCFGIGIFSLWGAKNTIWLKLNNIVLPEIQNMKLAGGDVWIFMGIILIIISFIFKRGIEIQNENDLTI